MMLAELCASRSLGGLELYFIRVVRHLERSGVPFAAVVAPGSAIESRLAGGSFELRRLPFRYRRLPLIAAWRLGRWLEARSVDVLHVHDGRDLNLAVLASQLARRRIRIVQTRQVFFGSKRSRFHRWVYGHVDLMLMISRQMLEQARDLLPLPPERVRLLYYGVAKPARPDPAACAALRERIGIPPGRFAVALFGRMQAQKGQHVLVDAIARLARAGHDVHAVLVGAPMSTAYLDELRAQIARLALADRVTIYGFHPQPGEIMGCFDCVVLASYDETFGLVLPEAMRAGVAVVGTNAGGVPEIIEHEVTGLLVPPRDAGALAGAIERLARDPSFRSRLARAGEASADERFDEDRHFAELLAVLL